MFKYGSFIWQESMLKISCECCVRKSSDSFHIFKWAKTVNTIWRQSSTEFAWSRKLINIVVNELFKLIHQRCLYTNIHRICFPVNKSDDACFPLLQIWSRFRLQENSWRPLSVCCQRPRTKRPVEYPALKPERCQSDSGGKVSISE